jgi:Flp pilus assembly protein TadB
MAHFKSKDDVLDQMAGCLAKFGPDSDEVKNLFAEVEATGMSAWVETAELAIELRRSYEQDRIYQSKKRQRAKSRRVHWPTLIVVTTTTLLMLPLIALLKMEFFVVVFPFVAIIFVLYILYTFLLSLGLGDKENDG